MNLWEKKKKEKIKKGYVDQTILLAETVSTSKTSLTIADESIKKLVTRLLAYAKQVIEEQYTISSSAVTKAMVDEAQRILNTMVTQKNIDDFNKQLLQLFRTIPRRMKNVAENFARNSSEMKEVLIREADLLDIMKGQVQTATPVTTNDNDDFLGSLGLEFKPASSDEKTIIRKSLGDVSDKFSNAWIVTNQKTERKFNDFITNEKIKEIKLLWHGSKNENWWSIINSGLLINPPAQTSGKMFGYGIYFAPKARKSLGYTSLNGSYWARGNSPTAFMSLYNVAYGKPYITNTNSGCGNMDYERLKRVDPQAHSLHAKEGQQLRNDEIIVYKESQVTIKYLVELT
jgi:poly [ADP-ribose] polymerase